MTPCSGRPHRHGAARPLRQPPAVTNIEAIQAMAGNRATAALVQATSGLVVQRSLLGNIRDGLLSGFRSVLDFFSRALGGNEPQTTETGETQPVVAEEQSAPVVEQSSETVEEEPSTLPVVESEQEEERPKSPVWAKLRTDWQRMASGEKTQSKIGATLARRMGVRADELWKQLEGIKKNGEQFKGQQRAIERELEKANARAKKFQNLIGGPETFMLKSEIETHLGEFKEGAHAFITQFHHKNFKGAWGGWGRAGDRNFVAPLPVANKLVDKAQQSKGIRTLEDELGIPAWSWVKNCEGNVIYRYIIPPEKLEEAGLEMARGVEGGAYAGEWVAGGNTLGGLKEAVIKTFQGKDFEMAEKTGIVKIQPLHLANTPEPPKEK